MLAFQYVSSFCLHSTAVYTTYEERSAIRTYPLLTVRRTLKLVLSRWWPKLCLYTYIYKWAPVIWILSATIGEVNTARILSAQSWRGFWNSVLACSHTEQCWVKKWWAEGINGQHRCNVKWCSGDQGSAIATGGEGWKNTAGHDLRRTRKGKDNPVSFSQPVFPQLPVPQKRFFFKCWENK